LEVRGKISAAAEEESHQEHAKEASHQVLLVNPISIVIVFGAAVRLLDISPTSFFKR